MPPSMDTLNTTPPSILFLPNQVWKLTAPRSVMCNYGLAGCSLQQVQELVCKHSSTDLLTSPCLRDGMEQQPSHLPELSLWLLRSGPLSHAEVKGSSVPPPLGFKEEFFHLRACEGGTPQAGFYFNKPSMKASKAPMGTLSSTLLPQSAPTTNTREQLNRHMTLKIKRQFHVGNKDMHTNQTQKSRDRRLQQGFGKCSAVQLAEFPSYLVVSHQPDSHQLLIVEAFM